MTAWVQLSQFVMRDPQLLLMYMCMPPLDINIFGCPLLPTLRLVQKLIATALRGRAALKQNPLGSQGKGCSCKDGQGPPL